MIGSYILLIELKFDRNIRVGKLGNIAFKKGFYIYVGSALNGLEQRIDRHLRSDKKIHWHIDYLLNYAKIVDVFFKENITKDECYFAKIFDNKLFSIPCFGSSDCKCKSHLFFGEFNKIENILEKLDISKYCTDGKT